MANRIVDAARSILNKFIPDIYIYTDHMKGLNSGKYVQALAADAVLKTQLRLFYNNNLFKCVLEYLWTCSKVDKLKTCDPIDGNTS